MTTKRVVVARPPLLQITATAIQLFRRARELEHGHPFRCARLDCVRCDDWRDTYQRLHHELRLKVWDSSPLDVDGAAPPDWMPATGRADWQKAWQLRRELSKHP